MRRAASAKGGAGAVAVGDLPGPQGRATLHSANTHLPGMRARIRRVVPRGPAADDRAAKTSASSRGAGKRMPMSQITAHFSILSKRAQTGDRTRPLCILCQPPSTFFNAGCTLSSGLVQVNHVGGIDLRCIIIRLYPVEAWLRIAPQSQRPTLLCTRFHPLGLRGALSFPYA